jgi:hypothetical protein
MLKKFVWWDAGLMVLDIRQDIFEMILIFAVASFDSKSMIDYAQVQELQDCKAGILEQQSMWKLTDHASPDFEMQVLRYWEVDLTPTDGTSPTPHLLQDKLSIQLSSPSSTFKPSASDQAIQASWVCAHGSTSTFQAASPQSSQVQVQISVLLCFPTAILAWCGWCSCLTSQDHMI